MTDQRDELHILRQCYLHELGLAESDWYNQNKGAMEMKQTLPKLKQP